jgi:hypothetical protein
LGAQRSQLPVETLQRRVEAGTRLLQRSAGARLRDPLLDTLRDRLRDRLLNRFGSARRLGLRRTRGRLGKGLGHRLQRQAACGDIEPGLQVGTGSLVVRHQRFRDRLGAEHQQRHTPRARCRRRVSRAAEGARLGQPGLGLGHPGLHGPEQATGPQARCGRRHPKFRALTLHPVGRVHRNAAAVVLHPDLRP